MKRQFSLSAVMILAASFVGLVVVAPAAQASTPSCAWQYSSLKTNAYWPDTNANYWLTSFTMSSDLTVTVNGSFPDARYMSVASYNSSGVASASNNIADYQIAPDAGSVNPWQQVAAPGGTYTVVFSNSPTGGNSLPFASVSSGSTAYLMYRAYLPNGTVTLPSLTFTTSTGSTTVQPCTTYSSPPSGGLFNNPDNNYVNFNPANPGTGNVVVITGKAATAPASNSPAPWPSGAQTRYWSWCSYNQWTTAVIGCSYDGNTKVDSSGNYHIVLGSSSQQAAIQAVPGATFVPYGGKVMLRNLMGNYTTGAYAPVVSTVAQSSLTGWN